MIKRLVRSIDVRDVIGLAGFGLLIYGVGRVNVDAAFIVAGIFMLAFTIVAARK